LKLTDYNFDLPKELIAKEPSKERTSSRLLVVDEPLTDRNFSNILDYFNKGDLLVVNDTKVFRARLEALKSSGGKVEILIERKLDNFNVLAMRNFLLETLKLWLKLFKKKIICAR
jgi:S-adenosylmethionine:tRNA ribosyltransferase-isomerase